MVLQQRRQCLSSTSDGGGEICVFAHAFLTFLGYFWFWMGNIKVARWNGVNFLIPKHMRKTKIGLLEQIWAKNPYVTFFLGHPVWYSMMFYDVLCLKSILVFLLSERTSGVSPVIFIVIIIIVDWRWMERTEWWFVETFYCGMFHKNAHLISVLWWSWLSEGWNDFSWQGRASRPTFESPS